MRAGYLPALLILRHYRLAIISARETGLECNIRRSILSNLFSAEVFALIPTC
jgi:hypothetical protein